MYRILLVDDEVWEKEFIEHTCQKVFGTLFKLDHATHGSEAVNYLLHGGYDLVLLDNRLSPAITAEFTVPFLKECSGTAKLVVISNNVQEEYLEDPALLGVNFILDKKYLEKFLELFRIEDANIPRLEKQRIYFGR